MLKENVIICTLINTGIVIPRVRFRWGGCLPVESNELVRVTESSAIMEEVMRTELLVTEIKLHRKTVEYTKHVLATYRLENRYPHKLFD